MGSCKGTGWKRAFGTGEWGEIDIPRKISNVKLSRIDRAHEYGIGSVFRLWRRNTRCWKQFRDAQHKTN